MSTIAEPNPIPQDHAEPPIVLNSWKEIAKYLGRTVRTVQRWEAELMLPVRRPHGRMRSAVLAFSTDLDEWLRRTPIGRTETPFKPRSNSFVDEQQQFAELTELRARSAELRRSVRETRAELRSAVSELSQTVRKVGWARTQWAALLPDEAV